MCLPFFFIFFFFNDTATTEIYTLSLHDALPIWISLIRQLAISRTPSLKVTSAGLVNLVSAWKRPSDVLMARSEEHTSELQSPDHLVCRLLLEKKKKLSATWAAKEEAVAAPQRYG